MARATLFPAIIVLCALGFVPMPGAAQVPASTAEQASALQPDSRKDLARQVAEVFLKRDWARLEHIAEEYRKPDAVFPSGQPKLSAFYQGTNWGLGTLEQQGAPKVEEALDAWAKFKPDSLTQTLARATYRRNAAWNARGGGTASTVSSTERASFAKFLQQSRTELAEVAKLRGAFDPEMLVLRLQIAKGLGSDATEVAAIVKEAAEKCPWYDPVFTQAAQLLMPRWQGSYPALEQYALETMQLLGAERGPIVFARIADSIAHFEGGKAIEVFKYDKINPAFLVMLNKYPNSLDNYKNFCWFAALAKDQAMAYELFQRVGTQWNESDLARWSSADQIKRYQQWAAGQGPHPEDSNPLEDAIEKGDIAQVRQLIDGGDDVNGVTPNGSTPLIAALDHGQRDIFFELIKRGADPVKSAPGGFTVAQAAVRTELVEALALTLKAGYPINQTVSEQKWTLLHEAAKFAAPQSAKLLLQQPGIDVNARLTNGQTPLHLAAAEGNAGIASMVVQAGADVNALDATKYTPLHLAAEAGKVEAVAFLLKSGANANLQTDRGLTALALAESRKKAEVAKLLRNAPAR